MTINELVALTGLTANDQIPVWDAEAAANGRTKKISAQNLANTIGPLAGLNLKTYTSVSQLNLSVGSATILTAFNALLDNSALYAPTGDFASGEVPGNGVVIIIKDYNARSYVEYKGKANTDADYRMYLGATAYNNQNQNAPTGSWVREWDSSTPIPTNAGGTGQTDFSLQAKMLTDVNLDTVTYNVIGYVSACTATGISAAIHGAFLSMSNNINGAENRTAQVIVRLGGEMIYRIYTSNGWQAWRQVTTTAYTG